MNKKYLTILILVLLFVLWWLIYTNIKTPKQIDTASKDPWFKEQWQYQDILRSTGSSSPENTSFEVTEGFKK
jgi:hypothetical protein